MHTVLKYGLCWHGILCCGNCKIWVELLLLVNSCVYCLSDNHYTHSRGSKSQKVSIARSMPFRGHIHMISSPMKSVVHNHVFSKFSGPLLILPIIS